MSYIETVDSDWGHFDPAGMKEKGLELREQYLAAEPFPHIVIDDFLPAALLEKCLEAFPEKPDPLSRTFDRDQERFKTSYHPDYLPAWPRQFFYSLNSQPFVSFVENLTGISGLIPDPCFVGGGFHETRQGGHLGVHADFNLHRSLKVERRVNVLIYLNRDWKPEYGGALELWDEKMTACAKSVTPAFGRCVVFSTTGESFHGHPEPVAHPDGGARRSIALYYYSATWDPAAAPKTTQFKARPGSGDAKDFHVRTIETLQEFLPPIIARPLLRRFAIRSGDGRG